MKGISPVVATVLLIAVVLAGAAIYQAALSKTVGAVTPRKSPKVSLSLAQTLAWDNFTELMFLQQGGDELKLSDLSMVIQGTVKNGSGESFDLIARVDGLREGSEVLALNSDAPSWARKFILHVTGNTVKTGKLILLLEGTDNAKFHILDKLTLVHRPSNNTMVFELGTPLQVPVVPPPPKIYPGTIIENLYLENTSITTHPAYGSLLTLKLTSDSPIDLGKIWAYEDMSFYPRAEFKGVARFDENLKRIVLTENEASQWGAMEYNAELAKGFYSKVEFANLDGNGGEALWLYVGCTTTPQSEDSFAGGYQIILDQAENKVRITYDGDVLAENDLAINNGWHSFRVVYYSGEFEVYYEGDLILSFTDAPRELGKLAGVGARTSSTHYNRFVVTYFELRDLLASVHVLGSSEQVSYVSGKVGIGIPYYWGTPIRENLEIYGHLKLSGPDVGIIGENLRLGAEMDNTEWHLDGWSFRRAIQIPETFMFLSGGISKTVTLEPVADAKVREGDPDGNYGTTADLRVESYYRFFVRNDHRSYLRFDLSSIPPGSTILSAKFMIYCTEADYKADDSFTAVLHFCGDDSWEETTITWNNQPYGTDPNPSENIIGSVTWYGPNDGQNPVDEWIKWAIPYDLVQRELDSDNLISLMMRTDIEAERAYGVWAEFNSREATSERPVLQVRYAEPGASVVRNAPDVQLLLTLDTKSLISQGKLKPDLSDLRFVTGDGTEIPWWVESGKNTTSTKIWIRVPSTPSKIYMYYGNPSATKSRLSDNIQATMDEGLRYFYYAGTNFDSYRGTDVYGAPNKCGGVVDNPAYGTTEKVAATFKGTHEVLRNGEIRPNNWIMFVYRVDPEDMMAPGVCCSKGSNFDTEYHRDHDGDGSHSFAIDVQAGALETEYEEVELRQFISPPIPAGSSLSGSFYWTTNGEFDQVTIKLEVLDGDSWSTVTSFSGEVGGATDWTSATGSYTTSSEVEWVRLYIYVEDYGGSVGDRYNWLWIDSVSLLSDGQERIVNGNFAQDIAVLPDWDWKVTYTTGDDSLATLVGQEHSADNSACLCVISGNGSQKDAEWWQSIGPIPPNTTIKIQFWYCYRGDGELDYENVQVKIRQDGSWESWGWCTDESHSVTTKKWYLFKKEYTTTGTVDNFLIHIGVRDDGDGQVSAILVDDLSLEVIDQAGDWENKTTNGKMADTDGDGQPDNWVLGDHSDPGETDKQPGWTTEDHTGDGSGSVKVWGYDRPWDGTTTYIGYAYWSQDLPTEIPAGYEVRGSLWYCYGGDGELDVEEIRLEVLEGSEWKTICSRYLSGSHSVSTGVWYQMQGQMTVRSSVTAVRLYIYVKDQAGIGGSEESWIAVDDVIIEARKPGTNSWEDATQNLSLRWEGWLLPPESGTYQLLVATDDACQLYENNRVVISQWRPQPPTLHKCKVDLVASVPVPVRLEWNQGEGEWRLGLGWVKPGGSITFPIPKQHLWCRKPALWEPEEIQVGQEQTFARIPYIDTSYPVLGPLKVRRLEASLENSENIGGDENWWWIRIGGLLIQWGQIKSGLTSEGGFSVSFPRPFNCLPVVIVTPEIETASSAENIWVCQVYDVSPLGFKAWLQQDKVNTGVDWDIPIHWMAIGW